MITAKEAAARSDKMQEADSFLKVKDLMETASANVEAYIKCNKRSVTMGLDRDNYNKVVVQLFVDELKHIGYTVCPVSMFDGEWRVIFSW
jgi:hypothetical protein